MLLVRTLISYVACTDHVILLTDRRCCFSHSARSALTRLRASGVVMSQYAHVQHLQASRRCNQQAYYNAHESRAEQKAP
jgi:hypothetical protein